MASVVGTKRQTAANRRNSRSQPPGARPMLRPARPHRCYPKKSRKILTGSHAALCDPYRLKNPAWQYPDRPSPFKTYKEFERLKAAREKQPEQSEESERAAEPFVR